AGEARGGEEGGIGGGLPSFKKKIKRRGRTRRDSCGVGGPVGLRRRVQVHWRGGCQLEVASELLPTPGAEVVGVVEQSVAWRRTTKQEVLAQSMEHASADPMQIALPVCHALKPSHASPRVASIYKMRRGAWRQRSPEPRFFFSSRRRHTRLVSDWSSDVCSSD